MRSLIVAVMLIGPACAQQAGGADDPPGNPLLGVSEYRVTETDSLLQIVGVDDDGAVVADLQLRIGHFVVPEFDFEPLGRQFKWSVNGTRYPDFASAGLAPLRLPRPPGELGTLVSDPYVAGVLSGWGVAWEDERSPAAEIAADEEAYQSCDGSPYFAPPCTSTMNTCEQFGSPNPPPTGETEQYVVCDNGDRVIRRCSWAFGPTSCGMAGQGGCATCGWYGVGGFTACWGDGCQWVN